MFPALHTSGEVTTFVRLCAPAPPAALTAALLTYFVSSAAFSIATALRSSIISRVKRKSRQPFNAARLCFSQSRVIPLPELCPPLRQIPPCTS
jgi:hypothetical protein